MKLKEQAAWGDHWTDLVECPYCSQTYFHLGPVAVSQQTDKITIANKGWEKGSPAGSPWLGPSIGHELSHECERGSQVRVQLQGECGHHFNFVLAFHKGQVFLWYEDLSDNPPKDRTLWRD